MKTSINNFLIHLLFRFLDPVRGEHDSKHEERWLAQSWGDPGFIAYCRHRDSEFLRECAGGLGLAEQPRDKYVRIIGQRFELLRFMDRCKKAYIESEKKKGK